MQRGLYLRPVVNTCRPPERLLQIRRQIVDDELGFAKVLRNKKMLEEFGGVQKERQLARPPKGFSVDSPHLEYLKLKDFMVWARSSLASAQ